MAEVDAEDRTEAPSKLRLQQARERGQVAHSAELTSAAALLAATIGLGLSGEGLFDAMLGLVRSPWVGGLATDLDVSGAVAQLRSSAWAVLGPAATIGLGAVGAALVTHQAQTGGLWAPGLVAPDLGRLWGGAGRGLAARAGRGAWVVAKTAVVLAVAAWAIRSRVDGLGRLGRLDTPALARAWAEAARGLLGTIAGATLALGVVDYALQRNRFGSMLRLTPEESREDRKAMDGDPAARGRRRRLARAWRGDAPELLAGATLVVVGPEGLAVILGGGPPPRRVVVRSAADGPTGRALRRSAEKARVAVVEHAGIARRLARLGTEANEAVTPEVLADLAPLWPAV